MAELKISMQDIGFPYLVHRKKFHVFCIERYLLLFWTETIRSHLNKINIINFINVALLKTNLFIVCNVFYKKRGNKKPRKKVSLRYYAALFTSTTDSRKNRRRRR